MDCPPPVEVREIVSRANQQWFWDGRTHQAAALYEQAARLASGDPVILFQSARAQWALGHTDAARSTLERARSQSSRLTSRGLERLAELERQVASGPRTRLPGRLRPDDLDIDRLRPVSLSASEWLDVAKAARERGLFGVVFFARDRAKGSITVTDEEKEDWELTKRAESEIALLDAMRECKKAN